MAITNKQIVFSAWCELVAEGIISEDETIHTYEYWRSIGYAVKRGSKAVISLMIWKYSEKKVLHFRLTDSILPEICK